MFRYKHTIFRQRNVPGLKPTASDKLLSTLFHSQQEAPLSMSLVYKRYNWHCF
jgi:hypothetical protein